MSNCTLDSNGNLLDASQIEWYNDPDDQAPISSSARPLTTTSSVSSTGPTMIGMFFHSLGSPTTKVAGARRSHRAMCPSAKIADLDNTVSSSRKHKAASNGSQASTSHCHHVASLLTSDADHDTMDTAPMSELVDTDKEDAVAEDNKDEGEDGNKPVNEPVEDGYLQTKTMADSDHKVSLSYAVTG
jgi:hypothetical protein